MGSRGHGGAHPGGDEGWTKVQQKPNRYDPNKMKLSKVMDCRFCWLTVCFLTTMYRLTEFEYNEKEDVYCLRQY